MAQSEERDTSTGKGGRVDREAHATDLELVRAALRGEPGATNALIERMGVVPAMVRSQNRKISARLTEEDLDEAAQEALLAVWGKLAAFEGRSRLETWVYGFVVREVLRARDRARRLDRSVEWVAEAEPQGSEGPRVDPDEHGALHASLEQIEAVSARIIHLKHFDVLTFEEIGARLAMPTNTVKTRYYRGLARLRTLLRPQWREQLS